MHTPKQLEKITLKGNFITLEPLSTTWHANDLWEEAGKDSSLWDYLFSGPFVQQETFFSWLALIEKNTDRLYFACMHNNRALGGLSLMNHSPQMSKIEIGGIFFGRRMQRSCLSTEAIFLIMANAFDYLGFQRLEWRCNSLNATSRSSALRFGFRFQEEWVGQSTPKGVRNACIFAMSQQEWLDSARPAFVKWLDPSNFTKEGSQKLSLVEIRQANKQ